MMERKVSGTSISSLIGERLPFCSGCNELIKEQYLLEAVEKFWHENCLKCSACKGPLAEMSTTCYYKSNLLFCKRDYFRIFGKNGNCSVCHREIPSFEYVMRARGNSYHLECFACQSCNQRFCVGDRFYLYEDRILCEVDYKDVLSSHGTSNNPNHHHHHHHYQHTHHGLDHHNNLHHVQHHPTNNTNHQVISSNCVNANNSGSHSANNTTNNNNTNSHNSNVNVKSDQPPGHHPTGPQQTRLYSCHDH